MWVARTATDSPIGSVLIRNPHPWIAAFNVLRIHCEMLWSLAAALAVIAFSSSAVKRTTTTLPFASPLGSFGLPTFLGLVGAGTFFELLYDGCLDGGLWRGYGREVKNSHMALRFVRVIRVVNPGIDAFRLRVPNQVKDFHYPIPDGLPLKDFFYGNAFNVLRFGLMDVVNYVSKFGYMTHGRHFATLEKNTSSRDNFLNCQRSYSSIIDPNSALAVIGKGYVTTEENLVVSDLENINSGHGASEANTNI